MPEKIAGVDVLLKVKDGSGALIPVAGQTGTSLNLGAETIDVTDKLSEGWKDAIAGLLSWSIEQDSFFTIDEDSLPLLRKQFLARKPIEVEIRVGEDDNAKGVTFAGKGYLTDFPHDFQQDDAVTFSLTIEGSGKLEITEGKAVTSTP